LDEVKRLAVYFDKTFAFLREVLVLYHYDHRLESYLALGNCCGGLLLTEALHALRGRHIS